MDMSKLSGKVAVVTGVSKGIGASIAKHLAAEGASIVVNYASDKKGADFVVAEIIKAGGKAIAVQASVAVESEVVSLFEQTAKAYGKVDVLVNNAGVYGKSSRGLDRPVAAPQLVPLRSDTRLVCIHDPTTQVFGAVGFP
jgi:3-oxoacyl-[acyl-carrier protein] reductase